MGGAICLVQHIIRIVNYVLEIATTMSEEAAGADETCREEHNGEGYPRYIFYKKRSGKV